MHTILQVIDWDLSPILTKIGSFELRYYPLMFVISFTIGVQIFKYIFKREHKNIEELDYLLFAMILGTIFGARIGEYIFYSPEMIFTNPIEVFLPIDIQQTSKIFGITLPFKFVGFRGLASHGAVFGILTALAVYSFKFKHPFLWVVDRIGVPTALAGMFIRFGNFFNHEIVGKAAKVPWAVDFSLASDDYNAQGINEVIYRHPTQIYEAMCYLATFVLLWSIYKKKGAKTPHGEIFGLFMMCIFGARFVIEFLKEAQNTNDTGILSSTGLNIGQWLSVAMILVGAFFYFIWSKKQGKKAVQA